ncbi:major facilitator superfamily domain-containing protein [Lipomyces japonicus]|uniref:major facilitator superfamily domain-containing protein n=1 Tax=Lipomyces japonicus TaxID=56871 RepID=UPI0034CDB300
MADIGNAKFKSDGIVDMVESESSALLSAEKHRRLSSSSSQYGAVDKEIPFRSDSGSEDEEYKRCEREIQDALSNGDVAWTEEEEKAVRFKTDVRVMILACVMFFSFDLDRSNLQQVVSSNFFFDTRMTGNDYNNGQSLFLITFLFLEIPSQMLNKRFGPERYLPFLMIVWGSVATIQVLINGRAFFLFTRAALGITEAGFVSSLAFYVTSFYKTNELSVRFSWIWSTQALQNAISALLASAILQMTNVGTLKNWQWLFLFEGLLTFGLGVMTAFMIPSLKRPRIASSFTLREAAILRARVELDDPTKKNQANKDVGKTHSISNIFTTTFGAITDRYLFPIFLLGYIGYIPAVTMRYYFTINMRYLDFSFTTINLLILPYVFINIVWTTTFSKMSDAYKVKWIFPILSAIWVFPNLLFLQFLSQNANRWFRFASWTWVLGYPYYQPILVSWVSANSNDPDRRALSQALYNIAVQLGNLTAANVYREGDAPYYHKGNYVLLALNILSMILAAVIKIYYTKENNRRDRIWKQMTKFEQDDYILHSEDKGNLRLDFRLKM